MTKIVANRSMRYGTRMLKAGDMFDAKPRDARLLIAIGRAKPAPTEAAIVEVVPPTPAQVEAITQVIGQTATQILPKPSVPLIEALRAEYLDRTGQTAPGNWGVPKLTKVISDLRNAV
jgi:hypothetical protein